MRTLSTSLLTLLLAVWTAVETGVVALAHPHVHGQCSSLAICGATPDEMHSHSSCKHEHAADRADHASSNAPVQNAPNGGENREQLRLTSSSDHPDDCTICRHFDQGRAAAALISNLLPLDVSPLLDSLAPPVPPAARLPVLHLRGPPNHVFSC